MGVPQWLDLDIFVAIIAAFACLFAAVSPIAMFCRGWLPKFLAESPGYWPRRVKRRIANTHWRWVIDYEVELYEAQGFRKVRCYWIREVRLRRKNGFAVLMNRWDVGKERMCQHFPNELEHVCTTVTADVYQKLCQELPEEQTTEDFLRRAILLALGLEGQPDRDSATL